MDDFEEYVDKLPTIYENEVLEFGESESDISVHSSPSSTLGREDDFGLCNRNVASHWNLTQSTTSILHQERLYPFLSTDRHIARQEGRSDPHHCANDYVTILERVNKDEEDPNYEDLDTCRENKYIFDFQKPQPISKDHSSDVFTVSKKYETSFALTETKTGQDHFQSKDRCYPKRGKLRNVKSTKINILVLVFMVSHLLLAILFICHLAGLIKTPGHGECKCQNGGQTHGVALKRTAGNSNRSSDTDLQDRIKLLEMQFAKEREQNSADIRDLSVNLNRFIAKVERGQSNSKKQCPVGWRKFKNSCYIYIQREASLRSASAYCKSLNSKLVVIETREENNFIKENFFGCPWFRKEVWIGLLGVLKRRRRRIVIWQGGLRTKFTNMASYVDQGRRGCFHIESTGLWYDDTCSAQKSAICEAPSPHLSKCGIQ